MLTRPLEFLVGWCWRHGIVVVLASLILSGGLGLYAADHLGMDTDEAKMLSPNLPFRKSEQTLDKAFPKGVDLLVVVIDAQTSSAAEQAVDRMAEALSKRTDVFKGVRRSPDDVYFRKNGLLFLSPAELTDLSDRLIAAQPMLGALARDPSLRGLLGAVDMTLEGVAHGQIEAKDLAPLLGQVDATAKAIAAGQTVAPLSWQSLFGDAASHDAPRRYLLTQPILHYGDLVAGRQATETIRETARTLGLDAAHGVSLRLTGPVALSDANFATVAAGVEISAPISLLAVVLLLFFAVRSAKVVVAILISLAAGLVATAAFAAATVGTLNPISVAFAVMFVGIAVDFAIQFVVRYRDERYLTADADRAITACAGAMAGPLSLAALATSVGFLSFLPTDYVGVSQLGLIAGGGMIIALIVDFTLLPALLGLLHPPAEKEPVGLPLAAADQWVERHAKPIVGVAVLLALAGAAILPILPMDFNPLHLQNPADEAVAMFLELAKDPDNGSYAVDVLAPSRQAAKQVADKFDGRGEVSRVMTLATFIPDDQDEKLAIIADLASLLRPTLSPATLLQAPDQDAQAKAIRDTVAKLGEVAANDALATSTAENLRRVEALGPDAVMALQQALVPGLNGQLTTLRGMLSLKAIVEADLPQDLVEDWTTRDGRARVQIVPKEDLNDRAALLRFVDVVRDKAPDASGLPVTIVQSGQAVIHAFTVAGLTALAAVGLLLGLALRRWLDALLVVLPLVMGALYTVICLTVAGIAINFANIIALPLLLGIGVAFNIYFVVNWRHGLKHHLQSATTRAVLFSALTTGSAFGSLAVSPHLGTSSMGLLLFLSLGLSVATTFLVLPAIFHILDEGQR